MSKNKRASSYFLWLTETCIYTLAWRHLSVLRIGLHTALHAGRQWTVKGVSWLQWGVWWEKCTKRYQPCIVQANELMVSMYKCITGISHHNILDCRPTRCGVTSLGVYSCSTLLSHLTYCTCHFVACPKVRTTAKWRWSLAHPMWSRKFCCSRQHHQRLRCVGGLVSVSGRCSCFGLVK